MRLIVNTYGWPTRNLVGKRASHLAWLLVQHADHNVGFQEHCLKLIKETGRNDEIIKSQIAFLTDRVLVNKGKSQVYGTQFYVDESGKIIPRPIFDIPHLDDRREEMGLGSFKEYKTEIERGWKNDSSKRGLNKKIETTIPEDLFIQVEPWAKPLLDELGEFEWGKYGFIVSSDKKELGEEQGWIIRKLSAESHYHVGIGLFHDEINKNFRFFVTTGGDTVVSDRLTEESLKKALEQASSSGPTHLAPPGRTPKRKR